MKSPARSTLPIRTAVIGYGLAGRVFHCPFISAVPGLELAAIVQRHGNEAQAAYPKTKVMRDVDELLVNETIDLVVVATPNETHFDLAQRLLLAGKHCVVDKPFAATSDEAATLISLAREKELLIVPFHNRRFDGDFLTVKALLHKGALGRLVEISSRFDRYRPLPRASSWKEQQGPMSGLLFDLGAHLIDQALALFGMPNAVDARVYKDREGSAVDDAFEVVLDFGDRGPRYRCGATLLAADPSPRFHLNGTLGSYIKHGVDPQEAAVGAGERPPAVGAEKSWLPEAEDAWGTLTVAEGTEIPAKLNRTSHPTLTGDYRLFYENVRDAIRDSVALIVSPEHGYRCIRVIELALQSNAETRSVPISFQL